MSRSLISSRALRAAFCALALLAGQALVGARALAEDVFLALPLPGLAGPDAGLDLRLGQALFERLWVAAPSSTRAADGLGPLYNARACLSCHPGTGGSGRGNGRGAAPGQGPAGGVLRLSAPDGGDGGDGLDRPHPLLGRQLQDHAVPGLEPEGRIALHWSEQRLTLGDGSQVILRKPRYSVQGQDAKVSPRLPPPLAGLGLLAALPAAAIAAGADPDDRDGDGIRGRVSRPSGAQAPLGRFGWKAGEASLADQVASAFALDIGLSSPAFPAPWGDCTPLQTACRAAPHGVDSHGDDPDGVMSAARDGHEISAQALALVSAYVAALAPPAPRPRDAGALRGQALFGDLGCAACHRPAWRLPPDPAHPALDGAEIWPYSDLLLHDMGEGLADHRPEGGLGGASGREWRTPPLWGLGLTPRAQGRSLFLHDGRAADLDEAILWHGGEAAAARDGFAALPATDRAALIRFLESL